MGPRVREDDSVRELIRTPSCHSRACGDPFIHTCQKPRLEITLTAADNNESETSSNNEALKPSYSARYPMGPRVREDDGVRELIRTNSNTDNEVRKTSHGARYPMGPRVREDDKNKKRKSRAKFSGKEQKNSAHCRHAPNRHSRACGDPFIHTCQKPRLEMHLPQQTTTKAKPTATRIMKCQNRATVLAIRWVPASARMTKIRKEKAELSSAAKNKKLSTPPPRPNCHSRAYGDPFIHTCLKPRLEMHSPQQTTTKAKPTTPAMKR